MNRLIEFGGDRLYQAAWVALRYGRSGQQQAPGIETMRKERRIRAALKGIGEIDPGKSSDLVCSKCQAVVMKQDPQAYRLKGERAELVLAQAEVELLRNYIDKGPWTADAAEDMADLDDALSAAPAVKDAG